MLNILCEMPIAAKQLTDTWDKKRDKVNWLLELERRQ